MALNNSISTEVRLNGSLIYSINEPAGRSATVFVAAADANERIKAHADYVCDGTIDDLDIQAAIDSLPATGGKIVLIGGTFTKSRLAGISIPSNVEIEIQGELRYLANVGAGAVMFVNSDSVGGNHSIYIHGGGKLNGNRANQSTGTQRGIVFTNVANSKIDIEMSGFTDIAVTTTGCSNISCVNRSYPYVNPLEKILPLQSYFLHHKNVSIIDPIDNNDGWTSGSTHVVWSTTEMAFGNSCVKMYPTIGTPGLCTISKTFSPALKVDPSYAYGTMLKVEGQQYLTFNVKISFSDGAHTVTMDKMTHNFYANDVNKGLNVWRVFADTVEKYKDAADYSSMNWDAITSVSITVYNSSWQTKDWYTYVDGLIQAKPLFPQGAVIISMDDGPVSAFTGAMPILGKYGFPGVVYVIPSQIGVGQYTLTLDQLRKCYEAGWEVSNHTWSHTPLAANKSIGLMEEEVLKAQSWIIEQGFGERAVSFAYPLGVITPNGSSVVHNHLYISRFTPQTEASKPYTPLPLFNPYCIIPFYPGVSDANMAAMKTAVDNAKRYHCCINFYLHGVEAGSTEITTITPEGFEEFIDYIAVSGVKVLTYAELVRMIKNNETDDSKLINSGSSIITGGSTNVSVTHGLANIPKTVQITLTSSLGNASIIYVSDKNIDNDKTKFQVSVDFDPGVNVTFDWIARI